MKISWKHVSVFVGLYTVLGFVAWIISILSDRARWCGIPVAAAKATGQTIPVQDCTITLGKVIDALRDLGLTLAGCAAVGILLWAAINLGAALTFNGPLGWGGGVREDRPEKKDGEA